MLIVPERDIADLMTRDAAFDAVEGVFAAMATQDAYNFPVIRGQIKVIAPRRRRHRSLQHARILISICGMMIRAILPSPKMVAPEMPEISP